MIPSLGSRARPISDNTPALRRLGYSKDEQTVASTRLNELGIAPDVIELQLAHRDHNKVRAVYNRADRLAEPHTMMQTRGRIISTVLRADQTGRCDRWGIAP